MNRIKKIRKMTWVLVAWAVAILAWVVDEAVRVHDAVATCVSKASIFKALCSPVANAAANQAYEQILLIGLGGFVVLGLIWFVTRPKPQAVTA